MFARIAPSYDKLNRIMTFGQDLKWRKEAAQALALSPDAAILDLGSGTGDMLFEILQHYPEATVVGTDFTTAMVQIGRNRKELDGVSWIIADAQSLPFAQSTFDGTISAFLMRNLDEITPTILEQYRVLREEGRLVCLETSPPQRNPLHHITSFYLNNIIPLLGAIFSRDMEAYTYLSVSTANFITPENLANKLTSIGFRQVHFVMRMFGMIAIHIAKKSKLSSNTGESAQ
jgi:demethylmenaquinone methyltransferase/2-methoxy-6-polyprenyl-1,4-benzoquinol methylase